MTEEQWFSANRPQPLIAYIEWSPNLTRYQRKLRLFCHACCCRLLPEEPNQTYVRALALMEQIADGTVRGDVDDAVNQLGQQLMLVRDDLSRIQSFAFSIGLSFSDHHTLSRAVRGVMYNTMAIRGPKEAVKLCFLLREIFGNPFRPITIDPRWRTSNVLDLANVVYHEWAFERMPILADALMDAGCDEEALLLHCREPAPHVRGCWALDLLLGKE